MVMRPDIIRNVPVSRMISSGFDDVPIKEYIIIEAIGDAILYAICITIAAFREPVHTLI